MPRKLLLSAIAGASIFAAAPALAGVVITFGGAPAVGGGLTTAIPGQTVVTFDGPGTPGALPYVENFVGYASAGGGGGAITNSSNPGLTAAPFGDTTNYLVVPSDTQNLSSGSAVAIDLSAIALENDYFGLYWGSIDTYNTISFGTVLGGIDFSFTGSDIAALVPTNPIGDQGPNGSLYVNFFFTDGDSYNTVLLESSQRAFESDNHAFGTVPEPGSLVLLSSCLIGIGLLRRRKES